MGGEAEVLIPSWNRAESLARTLRSLAEQSEACAVCVIDNGSEDGTAAMVRRDFPEVRLVELGVNAGFGAAINAGARDSEAELLILLNNDAVADGSFTAALLAAHRSQGAEMIAACLRQPDGRIDTLGVRVDHSLIAYELGHGSPYEPGSLEGADPLGPTGGAGAYRRQAFLEVGGFDEAIFAYLEDVDLALRMRLAGMRCATAYDAFAWHEHAGTLGSGSAAKNRLMGRARDRLLWKHGRNLGARARARGALLDAAVYAGQAVIDRNAGALRGRIEGRRRRPRGMRPGPDTRFEGVPLSPMTMRESLRLKLARRR